MALRMSMPSYIAMIAALIASLNLYSSFCKVSQDLTSEIYRNIVHRICRYSWGLHFCLRKWISMVGSSPRVSNCLLISKYMSTCQYNSIRAAYRAYREKWSPPNALPNTFQISLHPTWRPIALPPRDSSSATCAWRHFTSLQLASNRMPRWVVCLVDKLVAGAGPFNGNARLSPGHHPLEKKACLSNSGCFPNHEYDDMMMKKQG